MARQASRGVRDFLDRVVRSGCLVRLETEESLEYRYVLLFSSLLEPFLEFTCMTISPLFAFFRERGVCQVTGGQQVLRACRVPPETRAEKAILGSKDNW